MDIIRNRHARFFLEERGQIGGRDGAQAGQAGQGQIRVIVEVNIVHTGLHQRGIGSSGIVVHQHTVFADHSAGQGIELLRHQNGFNLDTQLSGKGVNMQRMDVATLYGLAQQGIERKQQILSVADRIRNPCGYFKLTKLE